MIFAVSEQTYHLNASFAYLVLYICLILIT